MMKKMVSMAMAAVMAATLMVAAAPAEVKAAGQETTVLYTNSSALGDEGSEIEVVLTIPATLTVDENTKTGTANITLEAAEEGGTLDEYSRQAAITVTSQNTWRLELADKSEGVAYTLAYGDNVASTTGTVGTLDKDNTLITGVAKVTETATVIGDYSDILTYTVTFSDK